MNLNLTDERILDALLGLYDPDAVDFVTNYDTMAMSFDIAGAPVTAVLERLHDGGAPTQNVKTSVYYSTPPIDLDSATALYKTQWMGSESEDRRYLRFLLQDLVKSIGQTELHPRVIFYHIREREMYEETVEPHSLVHGLPRDAPGVFNDCGLDNTNPGFAVGVRLCGRSMWKYALPSMRDAQIVLTSSPPSEYIHGSPPSVFTASTAEVGVQTGTSNLRWDRLSNGEWRVLDRSAVINSDYASEYTVNGVQLIDQHGRTGPATGQWELSDFGDTDAESPPETASVSLSLVR